MKKYLLTPGPTPVPNSVRLAEAQEIIHHRTPEFSKLFMEASEGMKHIFQTKEDVYIFPSVGSGAMQSAVVNLLSRDDTALVLETGKFGERWRDILGKYGVKAEVIAYDWGKAARVEDVEKKLKAHPEIKAVFTQLTETSTGIVNDLAALGALIKDTDAVLVVDAVSGLAGQEFRMDEWNVDVTVAGSQKGLMLPPGLAFISASRKAWKLVENSTLPKFYFDLKSYKKNFEKKTQPFTSAVSLIAALNEAINLIKKEGLENVFKRCARLASATRSGVGALGLKMFAETPCDVVTSVRVPEGVDGAALVKRMRDEYGVGIAGGQADYKGKIFRIAHMGYMYDFDIIIAISALEMMLNEMGHKVELGRGVAAVEKELLRK